MLEPTKTQQQLEHATNLEISSVVRHAASLDYKVTLVLEPLEGGQRIFANLGQSEQIGWNTTTRA